MLAPVGLLHQPCQLHNRPFAHAIDQHIGLAVEEDGGFEGVAPVVVVGEPPHGGFHAAKHDGRVREKLLEDARIDGRGVIGTETRLPAGGVGVVAAEPLVGGVVVDHGVHIAGGYPEEEARCAEFPEVAEVVLPVGLRQDGHAQSFALEHAPDDRRPERWMIHVGISVHDDDIDIVPTQIVEFLFSNRQKVLAVGHL